METPIKLDDLGVPPFSETPIWNSLGISVVILYMSILVKSQGLPV